MAGFTADEASTYDRQIRLWGVDTQERIRCSHIVLVGVTSISLEVAKNLTLSGIGKITIIDDKKVQPEHLGIMFLLSSSAIECQIADACARNLRELNPRVVIDVMAMNPQLVDSGTISQLSPTLVIASGLSLAQEIAINSHCRGLSKPFLCAQSFGFQAFLFLDLGTFSYREDRKTDGECAVETLKFLPLSEVLALDVGHIPRLAKRKPQWLTYYAYQRAELNVEDTLAQSCNKITHEDVVKFKTSHGLELSAVGAVVGGMIGQEVVKIISQVGRPIHNYFCFDGVSGEGVVETVGC